MATRCTVCTHPDRAAIDADLLQNGTAQDVLAQRFGVGRGALQRHKANHLRAVVSRIQADVEAKNEREVMRLVARCITRAEALADRAEAMLDAQGPTARGLTAAAHTLREVRAGIELLAKVMLRNPEEATETEARNAELDQALWRVLKDIELPALPSPQGVDDVAEAVLVPE